MEEPPAPAGSPWRRCPPCCARRSGPELRGPTCPTTGVWGSTPTIRYRRHTTRRSRIGTSSASTMRWSMAIPSSPRSTALDGPPHEGPPLPLEHGSDPADVGSASPEPAVKAPRPGPGLREHQPPPNTRPGRGRRSRGDDRRAAGELDPALRMIVRLAHMRIRRSADSDAAGPLRSSGTARAGG